MNKSEAARVISTHAGRENAIELGAAHMFEITRETALDRLCHAIEVLGGQVLSIDERWQSTGRIVGRKNQTVYTVIAILP